MPKRRLTAEERALWDAVARTIDPLHPETAFADDEASAGESHPVPTSKQARATRHSHRPDPGPQPLPDLSHDRQPGLDRRTEQKLKRGKVAIEGRLDLHGMTQAEGRAALVRFLERAYAEGRRMVLVITGKGTRATGEIGVLRQKVPEWLNDPALRPKILGFRYAARSHGGEGALYVMVKKNPQKG